MAGICTQTSGSGCGHRSLTLNFDGVEITLPRLHDDDLDSLDSADYEQLARLLLRYARQHRNSTITNFLGRVLLGEEATNVKIYTFFGPGAAITKTNIGSAYVNVCPGNSGERVLVDFTGCTEFRPMLTANLAAIGPFQVRIVRDGDSAVLYESPSIIQTGERELDPGWQPIPQGFNGQEMLRLQAKSATISDDPVFRRCQLGVR